MPDAPVILARSALLLLLAGAAAVFDWRARRIPNWLCLAAALSGLILNGWSGAQGLCIAVLLSAPFYLLRWRGAGDVKLLGAGGALAGFNGAIFLFAFSAVFSGIYAVVLMLRRSKAKALPFAIPFLLATLLLVLHSWAT